MRQRQEQSKDNPPETRKCPKCDHDIRPLWDKTHLRWRYQCGTCKSRKSRMNEDYCERMRQLARKRDRHKDYKRFLEHHPDYHKEKYARAKAKGIVNKGTVKRHRYPNNPNKRKVLGLTLEQCDALIEMQGNVCAICKQPETVKRRQRIARLSLDHDHNTGALRAFLCCNCNSALGLASDNPDRLRAMADYIESYRNGSKSS